MDVQQSIQYGMFIMPFHPPEKPLEQSLEEDLQLVIHAEELGFREFWVGEHHTMKYEPIVLPEAFIARASAVTQRIRMGPAPVCLQQHHPAHVACRLAFLDHLIGGRLNLCFGAGSVTADQELYGLNPRDGGEMVREAIEMILTLWTNDPPYHLDGAYWQIHLDESVDEETGISYIPRLLQDPLPEILVPAMSRNSPSMKMSGELGFSPFAHCLVTGNVVADFFETYESAARAAGREPDRSRYRLARSIFLGDDCNAAQEEARTNSLGQNYEYIGRLFDKGLGRKIYKRDLGMPDEECDLDFLFTEQIIAGDVPYVLERLLALHEETGDFGTLVLMSYDWGDKSRWLRSMELFATELMPALNVALGRPAVPDDV